MRTSMLVLLMKVACNPWLPSRAAPALTLKLPPLFEFALQAEKLPLSKPSLKIRSGTADVGVAVNVGAGVLVFVGVRKGPDVGVAVDVNVGVGVNAAMEVGVSVGVSVGVGDGPMMGVFVGVLTGVPGLVGVAVGEVPDSNRLNASTSFALNPQVLPSKKSVEEKLQAVALPREVGEQTKMSSSNPEIPVTAKSPRDER